MAAKRVSEQAAEAVLLEQFVDGFVVCWKRLVVSGLLAAFIVLLFVLVGVFLLASCSPML
jgi:hypothetical protein